MTSEKMNTIKQGVKQILEKYPKARDNYNYLWYYYCRDILKIKIYIPFELLDHGLIPSVESVTRAARKVWEEEKQQGRWNACAFKPSPEAQLARKENELMMKEWSTQNWATKNYKSEVISKYGY